MSREPMTIERHLLIGETLKKTRKTLFGIHSQIEKSYPKTSRVMNSARKLLSIFDSFKCKLDECLCKEVPREKWENEKLSRVYFGEETQVQFTNIIDIEPTSSIECYPENKWSFVMQWYCTNPDCVVRQIETHCKIIDRHDKEPKSAKCCVCENLLEFHGYVHRATTNKGTSEPCA